MRVTDNTTNLFVTLFDFDSTSELLMTKPTAPRPTCVNHGCNKPVASDGKRWRIHCGHCQGASYGRNPHAAGVTPLKTGICSNIDGHLGFPCVIDWKKVPEFAKGMTEIDHIDGNHLNNSISNLKELCPICHKLKGQRAGDFKRGRYTHK